jgi:hypothetical protein
MKGNLHVRFLEEGEGAIPSSYSAIARITRMHTDTIDPVFVFDQRGKNKMLRGELTDRNIWIGNLKSVIIRRIRVIRVPFCS